MRFIEKLFLWLIDGGGGVCMGGFEAGEAASARSSCSGSALTGADFDFVDFDERDRFPLRSDWSTILRISSSSIGRRSSLHSNYDE